MGIYQERKVAGGIFFIIFKLYFLIDNETFFILLCLLFQAANDKTPLKVN